MKAGRRRIAAEPEARALRGGAMRFRGIRGAVTVDENTERAIMDATSELLRRMVDANGVEVDDIAGVLFTGTPDLTACFPAEAGRRLPGWSQVPLMCAQEIPVPGALTKCVRVLMFVNTTRTPAEVRHVYLRGAEQLRPDLMSGA
jgi:chorismate mutase